MPSSLHYHIHIPPPLKCIFTNQNQNSINEYANHYKGQNFTLKSVTFSFSTWRINSFEKNNWSLQELNKNSSYFSWNCFNYKYDRESESKNLWPKWRQRITLKRTNLKKIVFYCPFICRKENAQNWWLRNNQNSVRPYICLNNLKRKDPRKIEFWRKQKFAR
jgi:hypothetical protein